MIDLKGLTLEEVRALSVRLGEKAFRGEQIFNFLYKGIENIDDIKTFSKETKEAFKQVAYISRAKVFDKLESKLDETVKYLIELDDGNIIESVLMKYNHGYSICISSQVGCRMGCKFCASTLDGLERNLTSGELLGQILTVSIDNNIKINNVVIMGSGEPLDNMDEIKKFLLLVHEEKGLNIGYRHITLSTCGIVPKIHELAELNIPINLAVSLHQWSQEKRMEIMPISRVYNIDQLIMASKMYYKKTKRRVTYEYALISGVNDSEADANALAKLIGGIDCHVNLIPVNEVKENSLKRPSKESVRKFCKILEDNKIKGTVRRELGQDISGACGQLRRSVNK
ncbi:MAG: 23S rRNA (adenine(2503)-C(2))-methyltransferase RlmN [Filifactoraceae bacterium]